MAKVYIVWLLLALPAVPIVLSHYGEALSKSGIVASVLVLATLAAPYLRRVLPGLMCYRRAVGVAAFGYSALHLGIYLSRKWAVALPDALTPELLSGWVAFAIYGALALTSRTTAVRAMGKRWKKLHRLTWVATALVALHWWLTAFDPMEASVFAAVLAVVAGIRVWRARSGALR